MSGYIGTQPVPQATQTRQTFTATASQTSFATGGYQAGYLDVFLNGVKLVDGTDYTATNGSDVVLTTGAASGDTLEVVAYTTFEVLNQNFTGGVTVDNNAATVLTVDRATSDGTIIDVQKNGTSVGSIGVAEGDTLTISNTGASPSTLYLRNDNKIIPMTDNVMDIGRSAQRFKDLYLSGGVYLGGTGSANLLDDYEEGTWTPTSSTLGNLSINKAQYTKIGRQVHLFAQFTSDSTSTVTLDNSFNLSGLPFAVDSGSPSGIGGILQFYASHGQSRNALADMLFSGGDLDCEIIVVRGSFTYANCITICVNVTYNTTA